MTWTQFLTAIAVVYAIYYALNLLSDILKSWKSGGENSDTEELFFREDVKPELVAPNEESIDETQQDSGQRPVQGPIIQSTGGVTRSEEQQDALQILMHNSYGVLLMNK